MRKCTVIAVLVAGGVLASGVAHAEPILALTTSNSLISFDSATPGTVSAPLLISGLGAGEAVVGIDFRPSTPGVLVALTRASDGTGRVYTVDTTSGAATLINTLTVALTATGEFDYGIDFNPVVNALRIVNNSDQNVRVTAGGSGTTIVDTSLNPAGSFVDAIAYSSNFAGASSTTLYAIRVGPEPDVLATIGSVGGTPISPNTGTLIDVAPLGPPNPTFFGDNAFDISGGTGVAFAMFRATVDGPTALYTVNLATGATTLIGAIGVTPGTLRDISVDNSVPEPGMLVLMGVGIAGVIRSARRRRRSNDAMP